MFNKDFVNSKQDIKLLYDIMKLSATICHRANVRKEFLIENLNKTAVWSEKTIWAQLYDHFCNIHHEKAKE